MFISGMYLYAEMSGIGHSMGTASQLDSPIIYPPPRYHSNISSPYYNSCYVRIEKCPIKNSQWNKFIIKIIVMF